MMGRSRLLFPLLGLAMLVCRVQGALEITPDMMRGRDFKPTIYGNYQGNNAGYLVSRARAKQPNPPGLVRGVVEFAAHDFELTPAMIHATNYGLANMVKAHMQVFGDRVSPGFRVRIRIFGNFEDYVAYSKVRYRKTVTKSLLGFFSGGSKEIVTWRQERRLKWRLVPTLLHEGCHAIMHDMFGELPFWMVEGSADWLGEAPAWLQKADGLRRDQLQRWINLDNMRRQGKLPALEDYLLTTDYGQWKKMFNGNIGRGYDVGWSIFDFFIVSSRRAKQNWPIQIMASAVQEAKRRPGASDEVIFLRTLQARWPKLTSRNLNGVKSFEFGWHNWIRLEADKARQALAKQR